MRLDVTIDSDMLNDQIDFMRDVLARARLAERERHAAAELLRVLEAIRSSLGTEAVPVLAGHAAGVAGGVGAGPSCAE